MWAIKRQKTAVATTWSINPLNTPKWGEEYEANMWAVALVP